MRRFKISGVPIVDGEGRLIGIITNRDLQFERNLDQPIREAMTKEKLVTAPVGTTLDEAERILASHRIEKLPVVDAEGVLKGLITVKDIFKRREHPNANKDQHGRLRVAAAVGGGADATVRARGLIDAGVDVLVVDSAHGHSEGVLRTVSQLRAGISRRPAHSRQHRDRSRRPGDGAARRRRRKGGHRPWEHLHDPRGHRCRCPAGHRDRGRGARRRRHPGHRRRRDQVFGRRGEGARLLARPPS